MSNRRNPFEELCTDEMTMQKASGEILGPFKGTLSPRQAVIFEGDLDVDEGDKVLRELPNGKVESYTIMEANYSAGLGEIPPCYNLTVHKDSSLLKKMPQHGTNINITGSQGVQIGDYNTQDVRTVFEGIVSKIDRADASEEDKKEAKSKLKAFLAHPLVTAVLGGAAGGLASQL